MLVRLSGMIEKRLSKSRVHALYIELGRELLAIGTIELI